MSKKNEKGADPFFSGSKERGRGGVWSHDRDTVGSAILGRFVRVEIVKFPPRKGEKGPKEVPALVFSPVLHRSADGELTVNASMSTLYSATLEGRIDPKADVGKVFAVKHTGYEKSKTRGRNDFKTFDVGESTVAILNAQLADEGRKDLQVSGRK